MYNPLFWQSYFNSSMAQNRFTDGEQPHQRRLFPGFARYMWQREGQSNGV
jgi:hypothetical protein